MLFFNFRPTVLHDHAASRLVKKSWICLEAKLMTPHWGGYRSLLFIPATPSSQSKRLFEMTLCP